LSGRADELEKEAAELRRENDWLKEIVILKGSRNAALIQNLDASTSSLRPSDRNAERSEPPDSDSDAEGSGKGKGKGKGK
jgi:hypothetical protein